jgi:hypothetical protein
MFEAKVGDEVGYARWDGVGYRSTGFALVTKINHHGHITLDTGAVFDKHGTERNASSWKRGLLKAEDLRAYLQRQDEQRKRNAISRELEQMILGQRNGYGNACPVSKEDRARMIELVNQL